VADFRKWTTFLNCLQAGWLSLGKQEDERVLSPFMILSTSKRGFLTKKQQAAYRSSCINCFKCGFVLAGMLLQARTWVDIYFLPIWI